VITRRVWLPSGRRVIVKIDLDAAAPTRNEKGLFGDAVALFGSKRFVVEHLKPAEPIDLAHLPLADFHVLRDVAIRAKALPSEPEAITCENCEAELSFDGATLPLDDLDDRYEGDAIDRERETTLPEPIVVDEHRYDRISTKQRTVADVRPLWRVLGKNAGFTITPKLVTAMGIVALEGKGAPRITDARMLARALADAPDASWQAVEDAFLALGYSERSIAPLVCPHCETVHDMEVPWPRELEPGQYTQARDADAPFPSAEELESHARRIADATWRRMDAGGLELRIEVDVPEIDSGGVPMLGSYSPEPRDDGGVDFVVRIYYRTFERSFRDDASFDWMHELEETIEHEAQHHLYYLSGDDPMDAAERAETERDAVRRAGGERRYRREQRAALASGVWDIVRALAPPLALTALVVVLMARCGT
jgi:hypothetical protein